MQKIKEVEPTHIGYVLGGVDHESKSNTSLYRVQTKKL